jgi:hypothetical protein
VQQSPAALPETPDPVVRINQAQQIANDLGVTASATGLGRLSCTAPLLLVRGTNTVFTETTLAWQSDSGSPRVSFDLASADGGSACTVTDLRIEGPGRDSGTDGIFLEGQSTTVGLSGIVFDRAIVQNFRHARVYGSHAYINSFHGSIFSRNHSGLYAPSGLTNVGEKTLDLDSIINGCDWGVILHSALHYEGERCSYDYNKDGDFDLNSGESGWVRLSGGNWEWNAAEMTGPRVLTGTNTTYSAQRSGYMSVYGTKITVKNPASWPAAHGLLRGQADLVVDTCHVYGVAATARFLADGGGRVISENCSFSGNPATCFFGGEGRGLNFDGSFESGSPSLVARGIYLQGEPGSEVTVVDTGYIAAARDPDAAFEGSHGLRLTFTADSYTGRRHILVLIPSVHGGLPCARFWTRAGSASGSTTAELLHADPWTMRTVNGVTMPVFEFDLPDVAKSYIGPTTIPHATSWQEVVLMPTQTPASLSLRNNHRTLILKLDLANTTNSTGTVDIDGLVLDMFGGRKR